MTRTLGLLALLGAAACAGAPSGPTDETDVGDTDDTDETDAPETDTVDTGESDPPDETDSHADTDPPVPTSLTVKGVMWCGNPEQDHAAGPGVVSITLGAAWACQPLSGCAETGIEVVASQEVGEDGTFDLTFDLLGYRPDELWFVTDTELGVCGNGYQFTERPFTEIDDLEDVFVEVWSIFY